MSQQLVPLHPTSMSSRMASSGTPRRASARRSLRISSTAWTMLSRHSAIVLPWPLAPGISGQYPMYQSPSRSMTAVNSLCIAAPPQRSLRRRRAPSLAALVYDLGVRGVGLDGGDALLHRLLRGVALADADDLVVPRLEHEVVLPVGHLAALVAPVVGGVLLDRRDPRL